MITYWPAGLPGLHHWPHCAHLAFHLRFLGLYLAFAEQVWPFPGRCLQSRGVQDLHMSGGRCKLVSIGILMPTFHADLLLSPTELHTTPSKSNAHRSVLIA